MEHLVLSCIESRLEKDQSIYGRFLVGPFKVGQAMTVATTLRRALLSELRGVAITAVSITGAAHEYSSVDGIRESALDIVLSLKQLVLAGEATIDLPAIGYINVQGPKVVRAGDLMLPTGIRCVNSNHYIATISSNGVLAMKVLISSGRGYLVHQPQSAKGLTTSILRPQSREGGVPLWPLSHCCPLPAIDPDLARAKLQRRGTSPSDRRYGRVLLTRQRHSAQLSRHVIDVVAYGWRRRGGQIRPGDEAASVDGGPSISEKAGPVGVAGVAWPPRRWPRGAKEPLAMEGGSQRGHWRGVTSTDHTSVASRLATSKALGRGVQRPEVPAHKGGDLLRHPMQRGGTKEMPTTPPPFRRDATLAVGSDATQSLATGPWQPSKQETPLAPMMPIDAIFMPIKRVNFLVQTDDQWPEPRERFVLEVWTNGSIHPRQAIAESATCLVHLFTLFRGAGPWPCQYPLSQPGHGGGAPGDPARGSLLRKGGDGRDAPQGGSAPGLDARLGDGLAASTRGTSQALRTAAQGLERIGWSSGHPPLKASRRPYGYPPSVPQGAPPAREDPLPPPSQEMRPGAAAGAGNGASTPKGEGSMGAGVFVIDGVGGPAPVDLGNLPLSVQAYVALKQAGIDTLEDLGRITPIMGIGARGRPGSSEGVFGGMAEALCNEIEAMADDLGLRDASDLPSSAEMPQE